ncbi:hypothetical protein KX928_13470 [Roseobacter sp. YSTF-M11]|uniref:Primosomal protein N' (Replication factor Y)-superfamily II helicase n=1 Tax=Roseobacter insulae TaxID=2859783 RepID=A0A9X1K2Q7_9RHOB|nr:hypothetical protein [Roseobacter insulae]MBW4708793.1 hypothetical protein [Roseobacter insulae]
MNEVEGVQGQLQCHACGGQCAFSPRARALLCRSCGTQHADALPDDPSAADETNYSDDMAGADLPTLVETRVHRCQSCGGSVVFTGAVLSTRCAYCDGPVVLTTQDSGYETMALIPFHIEEEAALAAARIWVTGRWARPNDLKVVVSKSRVAGLYAPFWTFDSHEAVHYWATYKARRGKTTRIRSTRGALGISFDDMLMPASHHVTPLIRDGILHEFDPAQLRPYGPAYLAGFAAERHHQSVAEGLRANAADKDLLIRNRIKTHVGKRVVKVTRYDAETTGVRYRRILLPVWMLHYQYRGKPMKVVVCGIHGRTFGERPFSRWKLAAYAAALSGGAVLAGLAWGAGGFL